MSSKGLQEKMPRLFLGGRTLQCIPICHGHTLFQTSD